MYGLAGCFSDHQFFYEDGTHWVWSFDHGHFFYGGPNWTPVSLASSPTAAPDPTIVNTCRLTPEEVQNALPNLRSALNESLALAVSSPAAAWGITMDDRIVLAEHLATRRDRLLT